MRLHSHEVHVWFISLKQPDQVLEPLKLLLSKEEKKRSEKFHFKHDRKNFIMAHGALQDILGRYLEGMKPPFKFSKNKQGKPFLKEKFLTFNLSHSGEMALVVVAKKRQVGVDVEKIRKEIDVKNISKRFFSTREVAQLTSLPSEKRIEAFYTYWTRKEAFIKAKGVGFSLPLNTFDVKDSLKWSFRDVKIPSQYGTKYRAAVCAEGTDWLLTQWDWKYTERHKCRDSALPFLTVPSTYNRVRLWACSSGALIHVISDVLNLSRCV